MPDEEVQLTEKQQQLMAFLNELATTPMTRERLAEGNRLLDDAASECREEQAKLRTSGEQAHG